MKLTIGEILEATGGKLMTGNPNDIATGISTDSRTLRRGNLFFALHGEKHDGHDHLEEVCRKGAVAAIVDRSIQTPLKNKIGVKDTLKALGDLAHFWRMKFPIPVVAVTGSNGKTTTKDMVAQILKTKFRVLKTEGNLNNLIGLPLTLFRLDKAAEVAVLEMGMNRPGEIGRLAAIAVPQIGVITNVARAHLEGLGSLARVARAKAELLPQLPKEGLAVLNADDPSFARLKKFVRSHTKIATFGKRRGAAVRLLSSQVDDLKGVMLTTDLHGKRVSFRMPVLGRHNISNALAAIAVADHLGVPLAKMKKALSVFRTLARRMEIISLPKGIDLINDCYNANPDSTAASLEFLKEAGEGRRRVAVLGEMLELGSFAGRAHREIGRKAAKAADLLFAVGEHAKEMAREFRGHAFETVEAAIPEIVKVLRPGDLVLIKGSRGMQMERITEALKDAL